MGRVVLGRRQGWGRGRGWNDNHSYFCTHRCYIDRYATIDRIPTKKKNKQFAVLVFGGRLSTNYARRRCFQNLYWCLTSDNTKRMSSGRNKGITKWEAKPSMLSCLISKTQFDMTFFSWAFPNITYMTDSKVHNKIVAMAICDPRVKLKLENSLLHNAPGPR